MEHASPATGRPRRNVANADSVPDQGLAALRSATTAYTALREELAEERHANAELIQELHDARPAFRLDASPRRALSRGGCRTRQRTRLAARRSYKEARSKEWSRDELRRCAGSQFDPRVVDAVLLAIEEVDAAADSTPAWDPGCGILPLVHSNPTAAARLDRG